MHKVMITLICLFSPIVAFSSLSASSTDQNMHWSGFYAGINAGYAWDDGQIIYDGRHATIATGHYSSNQESSFIGGVQAGYNQQQNVLVAGLEMDVNYANLKHSESIFNDYGFAYDNINAITNDDWFGTVRIRFGITPIRRLLIFTTGGVAVGHFDSKSQFAVVYPLLPNQNVTVHGSKSGSRFGHALGAGIEYFVLNNLTAKVEYLYVGLASRYYGVSGQYTNGDPIYYIVSDNPQFSFARFGLNYQFDQV